MALVNKYQVRTAVVALIAVGLLWLVAHALGDNVGEFLCELTFLLGTIVITSAIIVLGMYIVRGEKCQPNVVGIFLIVAVCMTIPHLVVSAKLAPAKWAFKLAVAERTAHPETVGQERIEAALAMRNEILRRSSAFNMGWDWRYDRHTDYLNVGGNIYIWIPFSGFFRKPATTNGLGFAPRPFLILETKI